MLRIFWNKTDDTFKFNLEKIANYAAQLEVTKRNVLSTMAKVFDPLGVISPLILPAKALFQEICVQQKGWYGQFRWSNNSASKAKRAAALDVDWSRKKLDQSIDQID